MEEGSSPKNEEEVPQEEQEEVTPGGPNEPVVSDANNAQGSPKQAQQPPEPMPQEPQEGEKESPNMAGKFEEEEEDKGDRVYADYEHLAPQPGQSYYKGELGEDEVEFGAEQPPDETMYEGSHIEPTREEGMDSGESDETQLRIAEIIKQCRENKRKYDDVEFFPDDSALYEDPNEFPDYHNPDYQWVRPEDISDNPKLLVEGMVPGDVKQGALGDCWLLGAFSCLATNPQLLQNLIVYDGLEFGFCVFQFFKNGEWRRVFIDTFMPFNPTGKHPLYAHCQDPNEFWVPLLEKAYAKLHGSYQKLHGGAMNIGLVDLTGGIAEKFNFKDPATAELIMTGQLWKMMKRFQASAFLMGCSNSQKDKDGIQEEGMGNQGILFNHAYSIIDVREVDSLRLIRLRNPWGHGEWTGAFSDDDEEWDKHKGLKDKLSYSFSYDGNWWMTFQHFVENYNRLYLCRIFPESWQQYSIPGEWKGKTAGGPYPVMIDRDEEAALMAQNNPPVGMNNTLGQTAVPGLGNTAMGATAIGGTQAGGNLATALAGGTRLDSNDKWFNNPQYRITISKPTRVFISLMQPDERISKKGYIPCNFLVVRSRSRRDRLWEVDKDDVIIRAADDQLRFAQRQIMKTALLEPISEKRPAHFVIVPNIEAEPKKDQERDFWLRIFTSEYCDIVELPETLQTTYNGEWTPETAGGRRILENGAQNQFWCKNPQFFLNLKKDTHLKIILKKTGGIKRTRGVPVGLCICKAYSPTNKPPSKPIKTTMAPTGTLKSGTIKGTGELGATQKRTTGADKFMIKFEPPTLEKLERKLQIMQNEWHQQSSFRNEEVAAMYFHWQPTQGPFMIVPSLLKEDFHANFSLTIFSSAPVELQKLEDARNAVLASRWVQKTAGGCHLYDKEFEKRQEKLTWSNNPKFLLKIDSISKASVKITLNRPDKVWKKRIAKDPIGCMIGLYIYEYGQNLTLQTVLNSPNFVPMNQINEQIELVPGKAGYVIMPTTYEPNKLGPFNISVATDVDFTLKELEV